MPGKRILAAVLAVSCVSPVMAQETARPDVAAQWQELLTHGTIEAANAASDAVDALGPLDAIDASKCRAQSAELAEALRQIPVSIMLQRAAMLCAEATGDHAAADRASSELAALARDAFAQASRGAWPKPIRIVFPGDAYALLESAGMSVRYELYTNLRAAPYFPWMIAATPRDGGSEQVLTFDYIDTLQTLDRKDPAYGTPRLRLMYVNSFIAEEIKGGVLRGIDTQAVKSAADESEPQKKVAALRAAAEDGGINSAATWLVVCARNPYANCADGLIDALLPQAEAHHAYPTVLLALAYAEGVGVAADRQSAETMLDAADRTWARHGAMTAFSDLFNIIHPEQPFPSFLRQRLIAARDAGDAAAAVALIASDMQVQGKKYMLTPADEARLADPANNGSGRGLMTLWSWYDARDKTKAEAYLKQAAEADNPLALRVLAYRLREAQGSAAPPAESLAWFEKAANGGDTGAMVYRGMLAWMDGSPRRAEDWVLPAVTAGDVNATFFLAKLWAGGYEGMSGTAKDAVSIYEELAKTKEHGARARRELASLAMAGKGMEKDLDRARSLLKQDALAGDVESQTALGDALLAGEFGKVDEVIGRQWMERAVAANSVEAMTDYGLWLHNSSTHPGDHVRGAAMSKKAADTGNETAINNTAWILCVSSYASVRDPIAGLVYSKKLEARPDIGAGAIDTIAACEAAAGNYARAAELQQRVVEEMRKQPKSDQQSLDAMLARLALYKAGKPYIEDPKPAKS